MGFEEYYTDYIEGLDQVSDNDEIACRAYNAGLEAAAVIAEEIERKHFDTVGNPMITTFTPWIAKAIREVT